MSFRSEDSHTATSKLKTTDDYDAIVSAEIPDPCHERLHTLVLQHMIHHHTPACMKDGFCTKWFPKDFCTCTGTEESGYPLYRRLSPQNGGQTAVVILNKGRKKFKKHVNNSLVVPYNAGLLLKFECHLNVEVCSTVKAVQYLYKYVYKGHDRAAMELRKKLRKEKGKDVKVAVDEIKNYLDARFISAPEAFWKLAKFFMHGRAPAVQQLAVHCNIHNTVTYNPNSVESTKRSMKKQERTTLTAWFECNAQEMITPSIDKKTGNVALPRARDLLYHEFPRHYRWMNEGKYWKHYQVNKWKIGRMHSAFPSQGERWYLRLLLCHVRGATSYADLRSFEDVEHPSFKQACAARGLLRDDAEWDSAMKEAASLQSGNQLMRFFAVLLKECDPVEPLVLFNKYKEHMLHDLWLDYRKITKTRSQNMSPTVRRQLENTALFTVCDILESYGKHLKDYGLTKPRKSDCIAVMCREMLCETSYDRDRCAALWTRNMETMNEEEQKQKYKEIMDAVYPATRTTIPPHKLFFVDAPGGTGKSFLCQTMLCDVRRRGDIALACASSGIAATNFEGGRTAHSRFKIPVRITNTSTCDMTRRSASFKLIKAAKVLIWDEAPMQRRWLMECVDRTLRKLLNNDEPFGGKVMVFCGDFRQVAPVIPRADFRQIV